MEEEMLVWVEDQLTTEQYLNLRRQVGWRELTVAQADKALGNSLYTLYVMQQGRPVGMGRLVGDGAVICYIQDLIVVPGAQQSGLGSKLMDRLRAKVEAIALPGTIMMLDLMSAKGREDFYRKQGFLARPTEDLGPGMIQYLHIEK